MGVVPPLPSFNKLIADLSKVIGGGYPVATTAGLATLKLCDDALYAKLDKKAIKVGSSISSAFI